MSTADSAIFQDAGSASSGPAKGLSGQTGFLALAGIICSLCFILAMLGLEIELGGDDSVYHELSGVALAVIGVLALASFRSRGRSTGAAAEQAAEVLQHTRAEAFEAAHIAKSRYLANVSHEIRSPLNAIYGYAQLVERDEGVCPQAAARVIRRCAEHLTSLVEGLLDVSQLENGVLRVRNETVRFPQFLEQVVSMLRPAAEAKGLELVFVPPARLPELVRFDPGRFRQVLLNLLSNAIKFTDAGQVTLRVRYAGEMATFEISDTGPGIPPDEIDTIFDPFERGADDGKLNKPGAGLGLPISRAIVRILGGEIDVSSKPGVGACFRVRMMMGEVTGQPQKSAQPSRLTGYDGLRRKILIVDDEAEQRAVLEGLLRPLGFDVTACANGEAATALARTRHFDLAILDITMPGMSGWETAAQLRESQNDMRIVMLSANAQEVHRPSYRETVHDHFMVKPFDFDELAGVVGGLLDVTWQAEASPERAKPSAPGNLPQLDDDASHHVERLRDLVRIGHARGIEAEIKQLSDKGGEAKRLAARLFERLDRFDLAGMAKDLHP